MGYIQAAMHAFAVACATFSFFFLGQYRLSSITFDAGADFNLMRDVPIRDASVPVVVGMPTTFAIRPALPPGLAFDDSNGAISGTATDWFKARTFTVSAENMHGKVETSITLGVGESPPVPPQICALANPKKDAFPMKCKPANFGDKLTGSRESWQPDDKTALDRSLQVVLTDPADGCSPDTKCVAGPNNTAVGCTGKIVLIKRGVCPFYQKACNMMMPHKAAAVVIYDNSKEEGGTDSLITLLRGSDPNPRKCSGEKQFPIPVVSVLHEDGVRMAKVVQTQPAEFIDAAEAFRLEANKDVSFTDKSGGAKRGGAHDMAEEMDLINNAIVTVDQHTYEKTARQRAGARWAWEVYNRTATAEEKERGGFTEIDMEDASQKEAEYNRLVNLQKQGGNELALMSISFEKEWPDYDREYGIRRDLVELAEAYVGTEQQQTEKMLALLNLAIAMNNQNKPPAALLPTLLLARRCTTAKSPRDKTATVLELMASVYGRDYQLGKAAAAYQKAGTFMDPGKERSLMNVKLQEILQQLEKGTDGNPIVPDLDADDATNAEAASASGVMTGAAAGGAAVAKAQAAPRKDGIEDVAGYAVAAGVLWLSGSVLKMHMK